MITSKIWLRCDQRQLQALFDFVWLQASDINIYDWSLITGPDWFYATTSKIYTIICDWGVIEDHCKPDRASVCRECLPTGDRNPFFEAYIQLLWLAGRARGCADGRGKLVSHCEQGGQNASALCTSTFLCYICLFSWFWNVVQGAVYSAQCGQNTSAQAHFWATYFCYLSSEM